MRLFGLRLGAECSAVAGAPEVFWPAIAFSFEVDIDVEKRVVSFDG